jgi:predicted RNA-binding Zn-ribbon protein involved in translation (DUF1610 family)
VPRSGRPGKTRSIADIAVIAGLCSLATVDQSFTSTVNFRCPYCGASDWLEVEVPEFDFSVDRMSDLHSEGQIEIACPNCEAEFLGRAVCSNLGCEITIDDPVHVEFFGDTPIYGTDPFDVYEPPDDPLALFEETIIRSLQLSRLHLDTKNDPQFVKRTAFVTVITALESFLADTIIGRIKADRETLKKIVAFDTDWSREKVSIGDLAKSDDLLYEFTLAKLRETNFHNLNRAATFYSNAFNVNIRADTDLWVRMLAYIKVRHDCVHRNGYDFDGNRRDDFTQEFIDAAAQDCRTIVLAIDDAMNPVPF